MRRRGIAACVLGRGVPAADAFVLDEFAYTRDEDAPTIAALLRAAAGDLRRIQGSLPPAPARAQTSAIPMLLPLSTAFRSAYRRTAPTFARDAGFC